VLDTQQSGDQDRFPRISAFRSGDLALYLREGLFGFFQARRPLGLTSPI
jgi:hypothetical protein